MVQLFGRSYTRREVAAHAGMLSQFAGVRLMTLGDGVERDIRMLEFRTGSGLRFTVLLDRAFDVADCEYKGQAIGWNSPSGSISRTIAWPLRIVSNSAVSGTGSSTRRPSGMRIERLSA